MMVWLQAVDEINDHTNKCKFAGDDEFSATSQAMEGLQVINGLECKITCNSSKVSYVLDTEDLLFRAKRKRRNYHQNSSCHNQTKVLNGYAIRLQRFQRWLSSS
ncbi:hypothetical protein ACOSQ4_018386 [Xanthoceras sorbifolium]